MIDSMAKQKAVQQTRVWLIFDNRQLWIILRLLFISLPEIDISLHEACFCCIFLVKLTQKTERGIIMTHEELRDKLLDYYGSATGIMPAAWGDVLAVQSADNDDLVRMAEDAGIDTPDLEAEDDWT